MNINVLLLNGYPSLNFHTSVSLEYLSKLFKDSCAYFANAYAVVTLALVVLFLGGNVSLVQVLAVLTVVLGIVASSVIISKSR